MRHFLTMTALTAMVALTACDEEATCTEAVLTEKMTALTAQIQTVAAKDPAKLTELMGRLQEIQTEAAENAADPAAAFAAIDSLMAELG